MEAARSMELVPTADLSAEIAKARAALEATDDIDDVVVIHERASAIEAAAKAVKGQRELYVAAGEVKIETERRAGEMRALVARFVGRRKRTFDYAEARRLRANGLSYKEIGKRLGANEGTIAAAARRGFPDDDTSDALGDFDARFGWYNNGAGPMRERLAGIPAEDYKKLLAEERERADPNFTCRAIVDRYYRSGATRTERNIWRLPDGRYRIHFTLDGVPRNKTLDTKDISVARAELVKKRVQLKKPRKVSGKLTEAEWHAGQAARNIDAYYHSLPAGHPKRKAASEAYNAATELEQAILRLLAMA